MADWGTIGIAAITATAALGGSLGSQVLSARNDRERHNREIERQAVEARRAAYVGLLAETTRLLAVADGATVSGRPARVDGQALDRFAAALVESELLAPADVWAEMQPLVTIVQVRINLVQGGMTGSLRNEAEALLTSLGGRSVEGLEAARARFLAAVKSDVQRRD